MRGEGLAVQVAVIYYSATGNVYKLRSSCKHASTKFRRMRAPSGRGEAGSLPDPGGGQRVVFRLVQALRRTFRGALRGGFGSGSGIREWLVLGGREY
jgi:hypothetical protein